MSMSGFRYRLFVASAVLGVLGMMNTSPISVFAQEWREPSPKLGTCTKEDTDLFKDLSYQDWKREYHETVASIIEGFLGKISTETLPPHREQERRSCTEISSVPAPKELTDLAKRLEPWKDTEETLGGSDAVPVLLEYLQVYECALAERSLVLPVAVLNDERKRREALPGNLEANPLYFTELFRLTYEQFQEISKELKIARPALERALAFAGTMTITATMQGDIECLAAASLQTRNALALSADTAACLPRIWNAEDALRDPAACSDGRDNDDDGDTDLADSGCSAPTDTTE